MIKHSVNSALTVPLKCVCAQALLPILNERFYWTECIKQLSVPLSQKNSDKKLGTLKMRRKEDRYTHAQYNLKATFPLQLLCVCTFTSEITPNGIFLHTLLNRRQVMKPLR